MTTPREKWEKLEKEARALTANPIDLTALQTHIGSKTCMECGKIFFAEFNRQFYCEPCRSDYWQFASRIIVDGNGKCTKQYCSRRNYSNSLCYPHYREYHGIPRTRSDKTCSFPGCDLPHHGKGLCAYHYRRANKQKGNQ